MGALFILLPDRREPLESVRQANELVHQLDTEKSTQRVQLPFTPVAHMTSIKAYRSFGSGVDPHTMLALLGQIDWAHPARVLYRTESENTWSFATLGLSLREEEGREPSFLDGY